MGLDTYFEEQVREIVRGGYDLHTHTNPSHFVRALDDVELARQCDEYGMAGVMIKSHYDSTAARTILGNRYGGAKATLYGGVALNRPVGGLNRYAAECTLKLGGKIIWLPTRDAENCLKKGPKPNDFFDRPSIQVLDQEGKPVPEIYEIFAVVKKYGAYLATGHISPAESLVICREGNACGVRMILTHPDWKQTKVPLKDQVALAQNGVMIEKVWGNVCNGHITAAEMADSIRTIGASHIYLVTDFGQMDNPSPAAGICDFVRALLREGIPPEVLKTMLCTNPEQIVGR